MKYINFKPSECLGCLCCMTIEDCTIKLDAIRHGGPCFEDDEQCKDCTRCVDICPGHALTKRSDTMNINKAVQNKDEPEAHAYIRAYDHGAVEREVPYVMHLGDTDDIAQALEERMHNCVHFDWDDIDEVHEIIEYVCNILELPEDQQCEQMINRLRGHLAAGESIDEELQGFVYDLFRKLCSDHNIQYADLDANNIIDAYEYILPKIKQHNGVDTMKDKINNIDLNAKAENIIRDIFNDSAFKWDEEHHTISRDQTAEQLHDTFGEYVHDLAANYNNMGEFYVIILDEAIKRYKAGAGMSDLEKLKAKEILHVQGGHVIINHCRIPDVWDVEVDHDVAENPLVICYDPDNNWLASMPLEDVHDFEIINNEEDL